jgi:hypothetical protein
MEKKNESDNRLTKNRIVRIKLIDGTLVNGQVNISREGGYDRVSDLISSKQEPFLILFDVALYDKSTETPMRQETLFVNKNHILWVEPDEDQK